MDSVYYAPVVARVWTRRRKWLGNLIPAIVWFPPTLAGIWLLWEADDVFSLGLWLLFVGQVVGWLGLNYFGLHDNERMHQDIKRIVEHRAPPPPGPVIFVGFASPRYHDILDAHQDIGFLSFGKEELEFIGDAQRVTLLRSQIVRVHFRPNIHSLLGLGRWIAIEGTISGRPVRMLIEPRERNTMLGNLMLGKWLMGLIDQWRRGEGLSANALKR